MDKATELALRTWYPKDHALHLKTHQPLGKLIGEWGELLDDYMKSLYKPGYNPWQPLDELGDVWYYLRILCYQAQHTPKVYDLGTHTPDKLIATAMGEAVKAFLNNHPMLGYLDVNYTVVWELVKGEGFTIEDLTEANWEKLKPGSVRGREWMREREY